MLARTVAIGSTADQPCIEDTREGYVEVALADFCINRLRTRKQKLQDVSHLELQLLVQGQTYRVLRIPENGM
jgi:hypothetical protein